MGLPRCVGWSEPQDLMSCVDPIFKLGNLDVLSFDFTTVRHRFLHLAARQIVAADVLTHVVYIAVTRSESGTAARC